MSQHVYAPDSPPPGWKMGTRDAVAHQERFSNGAQDADSHAEILHSTPKGGITARPSSAFSTPSGALWRNLGWAPARGTRVLRRSFTPCVAPSAVGLRKAAKSRSLSWSAMPTLIKPSLRILPVVLRPVINALRSFPARSRVQIGVVKCFCRASTRCSPSNRF